MSDENRVLTSEEARDLHRIEIAAEAGHAINNSDAKMLLWIVARLQNNLAIVIANVNEVHRLMKGLEESKGQHRPSNGGFPWFPESGEE